MSLWFVIQNPAMDALSAHAVDKLRPNGKGRQLRVRTGPDERAAFERAAMLSGVTLSTWVRQALREAAERRLLTAGERPEWTS